MKKRCLELWSEAVRTRDGHKCLLCGETELLTAHHWCAPKRGNPNWMFHTLNGATLCYACHIRKVHREDSSYILVRKIHDAVARSAGLNAYGMETFIETVQTKPDSGDCDHTEAGYRRILMGLSVKLGADPRDICATCARKYGTMVVAGTAKEGTRCGSCGNVTKTMQILPGSEDLEAQGGSHAASAN